jgi:hypothetical protein
VSTTAAGPSLPTTTTPGARDGGAGGAGGQHDSIHALIQRIRNHAFLDGQSHGGAAGLGHAAEAGNRLGRGGSGGSSGGGGVGVVRREPGGLTPASAAASSAAASLAQRAPSPPPHTYSRPTAVGAPPSAPDAPQMSREAGPDTTYGQSVPVLSGRAPAVTGNYEFLSLNYPHICAWYLISSKTLKLS